MRSDAGDRESLGSVVAKPTMCAFRFDTMMCSCQLSSRQPSIARNSKWNVCVKLFNQVE